MAIREYEIKNPLISFQSIFGRVYLIYLYRILQIPVRKMVFSNLFLYKPKIMLFKKI